MSRATVGSAWLTSVSDARTLSRQARSGTRRGTPSERDRTGARFHHPALRRTHGGVDFERVERELIHPVLLSLQIEGRTTGEIAEAGNIRTDVFEGLVSADLVIADISIHNGNVYYELGIRHAMRDRITVLLRSARTEVPFDLKTDRYVEYDAEDPGAQQPALMDAVQQSVTSRRQDSPVYLLLPGLEPTDPEANHPVPTDFTEEVREARRNEDLALLAVLAEEAAMFEWGVAGRRVVGRAQFDACAWPDARETWSAVLDQCPGDVEANLLLGTVYQRLGQLGRSSDALSRVLARQDVTPADRAECLALRARNAKSLWEAEWRRAAAPDRRSAALRSGFLEEASTAYDEAFLADQNGWYPGINALALHTVTLLLSRDLPTVWEERFETGDEARAGLDRLQRACAVLAAAVARSLDAHEFRCLRSGTEPTSWWELTRADLQLLTSRRPQVVHTAYRRARARVVEQLFAQTGFPLRSAAAQCRTYMDLGILTENAEAALEALDVSDEPTPLGPAARPRVVVFSGHRIDDPNRTEPRFPASSEAAAAVLLRDAVAAERSAANDGHVEGIAGGASGGDIVFHEVCAELGVPTTLGLALPPEPFIAASVAGAGPAWVERFNRLRARVAPRVLTDRAALPNWLARRRDDSIWQRNNRWLLHMALSRADTDVTLIVLWDGGGGDGPGGTEDMVRLARARGVKVVHLDTALLPGARQPDGP